MKGRIFFCCWLLCCRAGAQQVRTIVPMQQITAGTAFQVQYIITHPSELTGITPPSFDGLTLVSGPHRYKGNADVNGQRQPIENVTYTLIAQRTGVQKIGGLKAQFRGLPEQQSADNAVLIAPPPKASFHSSTSYTDVNLYAPPASADREQLITDNLFVRALVSKRSCYVGEPVTVTFKLYSRLQSTSEVTNVPSLYGFSVVDVMESNKAYMGVETINGQVFNTSVLRTLQLYPGQSGQLVIDGMDLDNEIEFDDPQFAGHKMVVHRAISSMPVAITARPLPAEQPDSYTGAVGSFTLRAELAPEMSASTTGALRLTISGTGNFIQLGPPAIAWPPGLDTLDPLITDTLDRHSIPEKGTRIYTYRFTTDSAGNYAVPPIVFSFFEPVSGRYTTLRSDTLHLRVRPAPRKAGAQAKDSRQTTSLPLIAGAVLVLAAVAIGWYRTRKKKAPATKEAPPAGEVELIKALAVLPPARAGVELEKILRRAAAADRIKPQKKAGLQPLLDECQLLSYSSIEAESKDELLARAQELFT